MIPPDREKPHENTSQDFMPRYLKDGMLIPFAKSVPTDSSIIIQSAIRGSSDFDSAKKFELAQIAKMSPDVTSIHSYAGSGAPTQIIDQDSEEKAVPYILKNIREAARGGWRGAIVIDCMADPAGREAKALVEELKTDIVIILPAETTMTSLAATYGTFAVVDICEPTPFVELAKKYELSDKMTGVFFPRKQITPEDIHQLGLDQVSEILYPAIEDARASGAASIMLGCTTLAGVTENLYATHPEYENFPIVEPLSFSLQRAVNYVENQNNKKSLQD